MNFIRAEICTTENLNDLEIARLFFDKIELLKLTPDAISFHEPITTKYSKEKAIEYWTKEEDGCWDFKEERHLGKAGGLLAKNRMLSLTFYISWWYRQDKKFVNYISFYISASKYKKVEKEFMELFKETISISKAAYAYIAHSDSIERQRTTGGIEHRIPGMFWCNYFSNVYLDFFGKDKFDSDFWFAKEEFPNGTIVYLDDKPDKRLLVDLSIEENAKVCLGYDSFANKQEEEIEKRNIVKWLNNDPVQYKRVPKLF